MMIDMESISSDELECLRVYLMGTPVFGFIDQVFKMEHIRAYRAKITSLSELGELYLIWSNLGGSKQYPKFKVKNAYDTLRQTKDVDQRSQCNWITVNNYIDLIEQDTIQMRITVSNTMVGNVPLDAILDGCKRTTAFYEYHRRLGHEEIDFNFTILRYLPE